MKYYKDEDFPEIRLSSTDIVAIIPNPKELQRIILEQNDLIDRLVSKDEEIEHLRIRIKVLESNKPAWATEEDILKVMRQIDCEDKIIKIAKEMICNRVIGGKRVCYEDCKWCDLCDALDKLNGVK